ncbi:PadR family transcriptional regulator, regulatory protein PadR [Spiroplasma syrphidicola EA-1]|uniref:PadR family transcriptional regulator, regulatory protein PadR n=1 Tax=Spiroplasma syrphidicola EA-1 TaxID=1276229 RepID=R4UEQ7_9MOLU|nr:PadR family transcriptional regulator [Spiroplasma syrphidicola]AGM26409.1 PadR family transcriptional regulator, regulatory protein PadR [Spiroplasma syrphidicola EA-1]
MDVQLKKGVIELVILKMLNKQDMYGYEINNQINTRLEINKSTVYAILQKLIINNYCEIFIGELSDGPIRKYYRLTEKGKAYLENLEGEWKKFMHKVQDLLKCDY